MRLAVLAGLGLVLAPTLILGACAATPPPRALPPEPAYPAPPPPPGAAGSAQLDWRAIVTTADRDRYQRRDAAWTLALAQARRQPGSGDLTTLGALIDPRAALQGPAPSPGNYRCRTVKLGSQGGADGLGYVVYGWFACRIETTARGLKFTKLTGSQRPSGLLFPEDARHMVMLGGVSLASEPPATSYGQRPDRDLVAVLERIGDRRWRLVIPWPENESNLDLIELIPAS
ncbi:hypothetical protein BH09PSE1_BH09PSE1_18600 [soil metagenome]